MANDDSDDSDSKSDDLISKAKTFKNFFERKRERVPSLERRLASRLAVEVVGYSKCSKRRAAHCRH